MKFWARANRDLIISMTIVLTLSVAAVQFETHELWHQITRAYTGWNLAERSGVLIALLAGSCWFSWGKARRLRQQMKRRDLEARLLGGGESRIFDCKFAL